MKNIFKYCKTIIFIILVLAGCKNNPQDKTSITTANDSYTVHNIFPSTTNSFMSITKSLPELKKNGFNVITINSIFPIGELNRNGDGNSYAVKDFFNINSDYGTIEDFILLVKTAHKNKIKVLINITVNYASWDNMILLEHPEWFIKDKEGAIIAPTNTLNDVAQIDLNRHEPRKYMISVLKHWIKETNIDGYSFNNVNNVPTSFWNIAQIELNKNKKTIMLFNN